jgi:hypothetical protein
MISLFDSFIQTGMQGNIDNIFHLAVHSLEVSFRAVGNEVLFKYFHRLQIMILRVIGTVFLE